jgi:hypothetical protein
MLRELSGNVAVPSAVRNSDCTTTMRRTTSSPGSTVQARATSMRSFSLPAAGALSEIDA